MTRKERMETLGHPATRFTNIYVKNFGEANLSDEEFEGVRKEREREISVELFYFKRQTPHLYFLSKIVRLRERGLRK